MKKYILILLLLTVAPTLNSQTLEKGAIAIIGVNEDPGPTSGRDHSFTWIALTDIPAGEVIYFTEQGWNNNNTDTSVNPDFTPSGYWMQNTEGHFSWTSPVGGISIGTIIHMYETGTDVLNVVGGGSVSGLLATSSPNKWNLSGGDQILAYQSASGVKPTGQVPAFIAAIHLDDGLSVSIGQDPLTGWTSAGFSDSGVNASHVPPGLTNGVHCIAVFNPDDSRDYENDNIRYTGTLSGTNDEVRAQINSGFAFGAGFAIKNIYSNVFIVFECVPRSE